MKLPVVLFTVPAIFGLAACSESHVVTYSSVLPPGPVRSVTDEPGVVPTGTSLVVRTNAAVRVSKASRSTIYDANVAEDVLDQNGTVLIPRESPVEMVVRSRSYLGPGGAGMTDLILAIKTLTVKGVIYPVATESAKPGPGGLGLDKDAPKQIGDSAAGNEAVTRGRRILVPARTVLAFQIADPIRLRGYRR